MKYKWTSWDMQILMLATVANHLLLSLTTAFGERELGMLKSGLLTSDTFPASHVSGQKPIR